MGRFLQAPDTKITLGSTAYTNEKGLNISVRRLECGFDTASIQLNDYLSELYPSIVTVGTAIQVDVKDRSESSYPTNPLFKGIVRFPILPYGNIETVTLKCDGSGYGFADTVCGQEYGASSRYKTTVDTASEILTEASHGIITKWVNKQMESATASGFSYTTSISASLTDTISYIYFPYKPCNKAVDDLCDLLTAIRVEGANKGPHWIVTTDDVFRMKEIAADDANWHKYYNSTAAGDDAKLYQGKDFLEYNFEKMGPEANYVIYYGAWRRPSNGDAWTENNSADWAVPAGAGCTITDDAGAGNYRVNSASILITGNSVVNPIVAVYPSTTDWGYDFSGFREYNVPSFSFWAKKNGTLNGADVRLSDADGNEFGYTFTALLAAADQWYHICLPVGDYYKTAGSAIWTYVDAAASWDDIDYVSFISNAVNGAKLWIDGMHFGDAWVCRVAYNSTNITANKLKIKVVTDDVGKDDTLTSGTLGTTDTGLMARMAYAELLRSQTTSLVGWVRTPMIKDLLPGQLFQIYAKKTATGSYNINGTEMRVTKVDHEISASGATSVITLTDDVTNSHPRPRYEDWNKVLASSARPEFQDRQSTSMKAGQIDIRVARLAEDYG